MTRKKNGFLTFVFSLIPGAGEMYMGFFKQGISIMSVVFMLISVSSWLDLGPLMFILPVLWFYSFFHVHNLASLSDEEFYSLEDKYLFDYDNHKLQTMFGSDKGRRILAIALIIVGASAVWNILMDFLESFFAIWDMDMGWFYQVSYKVPQFAFGIAIILIGIHLIRGKKKELYAIEEKQEQLNDITIENNQYNSMQYDNNENDEADGRTVE